MNIIIVSPLIPAQAERKIRCAGFRAFLHEFHFFSFVIIAKTKYYELFFL